MPKGKPHPAELKARVALEVMRGERAASVRSPCKAKRVLAARALTRETWIRS